VPQRTKDSATDRLFGALANPTRRDVLDLLLRGPRTVGLGSQAIDTGLKFGQRLFSPPAFRMTIAAFNVRAQTVVRSLGFRAVMRFAALTDGKDYDIFVRPS
jgi:DNA-binding transcriptional ArsR family regulator